MKVELSNAELEQLLKSALIDRQGDMSSIVLIAPSFHEVQLATITGPDAEITFPCTGRASFMDVSATDTEAVIRTRLVFESLTLTEISDLVDKKDGWFDFKGNVVHYDEPYEHHPDVVSYSFNSYSVSVSPHGTSRYWQTGGGHGVHHLSEMKNRRR